MLRDAEKDLVFAVGKLQSGNRVAAYLNALMAIVHIGQAMTEAEHQQALLATTRAVESTQ
jgi:surface antigen